MAEYGLVCDHEAMLEDGYSEKEMPFFKKQKKFPVDISYIDAGVLLSMSECHSAAINFGAKKGDKVLFYGRRPVNDMPQFYRMADAMLITLKDNKTLSYTLPGKIQSYMAARKPIIGAINGETRRIIETAECGLCCDAEDYKGLALIILKFCYSRNINKMAANSQKFYFDNYDKENFMTSLENTLLELED
jgi:glycosyltransferase involved in cell wall biosynthesis